MDIWERFWQSLTLSAPTHKKLQMQAGTKAIRNHNHCLHHYAGHEGGIIAMGNVQLP